MQRVSGHDGPGESRCADHHCDSPANYHTEAGGLTFADGHAEIRTWHDPRATPALKRILLDYFVGPPYNVDMMWMRERTSSQK
jgi:hypothetical protein